MFDVESLSPGGFQIPVFQTKFFQIPIFPPPLSVEVEYLSPGGFQIPVFPTKFLFSLLIVFVNSCTPCTIKS
jgi:hypothetical protein